MVGMVLSALLLSITYHIEPTAGLVVQERFTPAQLSLLQKLNRTDLEHLQRLHALVVPDLWLDDELAYSPLPVRYADGGRHPRLLVVYQPGQVFAAYEYGVLVRWGPVSTGRKSHATPEGRFHLNWRARAHTSTIDPDWFMAWAFNFDNRLGLAFHQYELPGKPASHGCVRLLEQDARWLFEWGETWTVDDSGTRILKPGTPVVVVGSYAFDAPPPWTAIEWLARPVSLPAL